MNKCCSKLALSKKAVFEVLSVQHWCGPQTKNASFHVLRVAILIYKFHTAFLYDCLFSRLCINLFADVTPAPFFLQDSAGPRQIVCDLSMTQQGPAEEAGHTLSPGGREG